MTAPASYVLIQADGSYAPVLAELHGESFAEGWSASSFQTTLETPGSLAYIAVHADDQDPLGFGLFRLSGGGSGGAGGEGEVLTIATRPAARGQGIAKALMQAALGDARRLTIQTFFLEVAVDNVPAIGLYRALGFVETGRRPAYYARANGPRVDALMMALVL